MKVYQKGQGLVEYALLFGLVGAIALFVMLNGGFRASIENLFGSSGDNLSSVNALNVITADDDNNYDETDLESDSSDTTQDFPPLNWQRDIIPFADGTYNTIARNPSVDDALRSEVGFFNTLLTFANGGLASTRAEDGTKDWESFLAMVNSTKARNNIQSTYVRDEQKITVKTAGKALTITYADKENMTYYKFSPDANNVMQIETNSNKSYGQFYSSVMKNADGGGWQYGK